MKLFVIAIFVFISIGGCSPLPGKSAYFDSNGTRIHYRDTGIGDPIILLHGFATSGTTQWTALARKMPSKYRLIIPDHRGHGDSDKPLGEENYGKEMVNDVIRLMDHLDIPRAKLVGMSMGGFMAISAIANHPEAFDCAFIAASGMTDAENFEQMIEEDIALAFERGEGFEMLFKRLNPVELDQQDKKSGWLGGFFFNLLIANQDPELLASIYRGMKGFAVERSVLANTKTHAFIFIGELDGMLPVAKWHAEVSQTTELLVLKGHDHGSIGGDPTFIPTMEAFFSNEDRCN